MSDTDYDEVSIHPATHELVWESDGYSHYCGICGWEEPGPDLPVTATQ